MDWIPDHEHLDVYRVALPFVEDVHNLAPDEIAGRKRLAVRIIAMLVQLAK